VSTATGSGVDSEAASEAGWSDAVSVARAGSVIVLFQVGLWLAWYGGIEVPTKVAAQFGIGRSAYRYSARKNQEHIDREETAAHQCVGANFYPARSLLTTLAV
jgi:hypothetical protein